jgi:hypothetical protein
MRKLFFLALATLAFCFAQPSAHAQTHGETLIVYSTSCTQTSPCTAQITRTQGACAGNTLSPSTLTSTLAATTLTATDSSFSFTDSTVVAGTSYCYAATVTFNSGGGPSPASQYTAAIPFPTPAPPVLSGSYQ